MSIGILVIFEIYFCLFLLFCLYTARITRYALFAALFLSVAAISGAPFQSIDCG